jgi:hypothetical protein
MHKQITSAVGNLEMYNRWLHYLWMVRRAPMHRVKAAIALASLLVKLKVIPLRDLQKLSGYRK